MDLTITTRGNVADDWSLKFELTEEVKAAFDQESIYLPFPQHDVHRYQSSGQET